jgi:DNA-binding phage protein
MGGGIVSSVTYSMFLLIMVFLVVTNYKGMTAVMKQGGTSTVSLVKALQGR